VKLYTPEWRNARIALHEPLTSYLKSSDMGSFTYYLEPRGVSIKHRMRKDEIAVISLGCWLGSEVVLFKTVAFPEDPTLTGRQLANFLESGVLPALPLVSYPGYEKWDTEVKERSIK